MLSRRNLLHLAASVVCAPLARFLPRREEPTASPWQGYLHPHTNLSAKELKSQLRKAIQNHEFQPLLRDKDILAALEKRHAEILDEIVRQEEEWLWGG